MNFTHATNTQNVVIDSSGIDITTQDGYQTTLRYGKIGIGTSNPDEKLHLCKETSSGYDMGSDYLTTNMDVGTLLHIDSAKNNTNTNNFSAIKNFEFLQYQGYQVVPLVITFYNFFNNILLYKSGKKDLFSINKIISSNMSKYSSCFTNEEIMNIIVDLKKIDLTIKSSNLNQNNLVSIFITKICQNYYG